MSGQLSPSTPLQGFHVAAAQHQHQMFSHPLSGGGGVHGMITAGHGMMPHHASLGSSHRPGGLASSCPPAKLGHHMGSETNQWEVFSSVTAQAVQVYKPVNKQEVRVVYRIRQCKNPQLVNTRHQKSYSFNKYGEEEAWSRARRAYHHINASGRLPSDFSMPSAPNTTRKSSKRRNATGATLAAQATVDVINSGGVRGASVDAMFGVENWNAGASLRHPDLTSLFGREGVGGVTSPNSLMSRPSQIFSPMSSPSAAAQMPPSQNQNVMPTPLVAPPSAVGGNLSFPFGWSAPLMRAEQLPSLSNTDPRLSCRSPLAPSNRFLYPYPHPSSPSLSLQGWPLRLSLASLLGTGEGTDFPDLEEDEEQSPFHPPEVSRDIIERLLAQMSYSADFSKIEEACRESGDEEEEKIQPSAMNTPFAFDMNIVKKENVDSMVSDVSTDYGSLSPETSLPLQNETASGLLASLCSTSPEHPSALEVKTEDDDDDSLALAVSLSESLSPENSFIDDVSTKSLHDSTEIKPEMIIVAEEHQWDEEGSLINCGSVQSTSQDPSENESSAGVLGCAPTEILAMMESKSLDLADFKDKINDRWKLGQEQSQQEDMDQPRRKRAGACLSSVTHKKRRKVNGLGSQEAVHDPALVKSDVQKKSNNKLKKYISKRRHRKRVQKTLPCPRLLEQLFCPDAVWQVAEKLSLFTKEEIQTFAELRPQEASLQTRQETPYDSNGMSCFPSQNSIAELASSLQSAATLPVISRRRRHIADYQTYVQRQVKRECLAAADALVPSAVFPLRGRHTKPLEQDTSIADTIFDSTWTAADKMSDVSDCPGDEERTYSTADSNTFPRDYDHPTALFNHIDNRPETQLECSQELAESPIQGRKESGHAQTRSPRCTPKCELLNRTGKQHRQSTNPEISGSARLSWPPPGGLLASQPPTPSNQLPPGGSTEKLRGYRYDCTLPARPLPGSPGRAGPTTKIVVKEEISGSTRPLLPAIAGSGPGVFVGRENFGCVRAGSPPLQRMNGAMRIVQGSFGQTPIVGRDAGSSMDGYQRNCTHQRNPAVLVGGQAATDALADVLTGTAIPRRAFVRNDAAKLRSTQSLPPDPPRHGIRSRPAVPFNPKKRMNMAKVKKLPTIGAPAVLLPSITSTHSMFPPPPPPLPARPSSILPHVPSACPIPPPPPPPTETALID